MPEGRQRSRSPVARTSSTASAPSLPGTASTAQRGLFDRSGPVFLGELEIHSLTPDYPQAVTLSHVADPSARKPRQGECSDNPRPPPPGRSSRAVSSI